MTFSNFTPAFPFTIRMEEYQDIKVQNDTATEVFLVCNGQMHRMKEDKEVVNGFKLRFYGWMGAIGDDLDIVVIGLNGDTYTESSIVTITMPEAPILPILQFILNWLKNHPVMGQKSFAKVFETKRKPFKQITTRPQFLATTASGDIDKPHIGSVASEWKEYIEIIYIADIRKKIDLEKHEYFLFHLERYLSNNPNLSNVVGLVEIDTTGYNMPDERLENIYLHQSTLRCLASVIPEYADQVP